MNKSVSFSVLLAAGLYVSACSGSEPVTDEAVSDSEAIEGEAGQVVAPDPDGERAEVVDTAIIPREDVLTDENDLKLMALDLTDFQQIMGPLKGCSFQVKGSKEALLVANAPVDGKSHPQAIVRLQGDRVAMQSSEAGGMDYLAAGPQFKSGELRISITPDEGEGRADNMKGRVWDAAMVVRGAGNSVRVYRGGEYSCEL